MAACFIYQLISKTLRLLQADRVVQDDTHKLEELGSAFIQDLWCLLPRDNLNQDLALNNFSRGHVLCI
ncbi:hypothetical protein RRG08_056356 [Elysia crispata]|uniref:Uncharacterized protein n=1 Tax=Elysia crispata TaxID=231223 RepID=A0AAE0YQL3_9GAST|nr:hypothetical protein RRG08_056356 [Elysia crispata]